MFILEGSCAPANFTPKPRLTVVSDQLAIVCVNLWNLSDKGLRVVVAAIKHLIELQIFLVPYSYDTVML